MIDLTRISKNNKFFFLAYDQGLEHGPADFNLTTANPQYVFDLTKSGIFTGIIAQKGIAEKYYTSEMYKTPLIVKLNGKTHFMEHDPYAPQLCCVEEAVRLRAKAVGYTIYIGSKYESKMLKEFSNIVYEAHDMGIPVIGWMYSRGSHIHEENADTIAYAARVGLELGADLVKVKYPGNTDGMKWVTACADMLPVCIAGGNHMPHDILMDEIRGAMGGGAKGAVVGRNIWQDSNPLARAKEISDIIFE